MNLSYLQINAATLAHGYSDALLVMFLLEMFPEEKRSGRMKYWISELENGCVAGMHQWNNLATIILGYAQLHGFNCTQPAAYCIHMALNSKPPEVIVTEEPIPRWQAQQSRLSD